MRLRHLLIAAAALAGLATVAAVVFVATFDANRYKPELIELVRDRTGRTLAIDGELSLALMPRIGLSVGPARLSGPAGRGEFAQIDSARIGVALWPLLARNVVVDRVVLDGLKLEGVRARDGTTNFDDLLRPAAGSGEAPQAEAAAGTAAAAITIAGLQLRNATIGWRDEAAGTEWRLQQADFETDRLASGEPGSARLSGRLIGKRPLVDVAIELSTDYSVDFATRATRLTDLELRLRGRTPVSPGLDARLVGRIMVDPSQRRLDLADVGLAARSGDGVEARLDVPALSLGDEGASGDPVRGQATFRRGEQRIDAVVSIAAPSRSQDRIVFGDVRADVKMAGPQLPPGGLAVALAGDGSVDPARETATLSLDGRADGSALQARLTATRFAPLALSYELQADRLDLDRYRIASVAPGGERADGATGAGATRSGASGPAATTEAAPGAIAVPPIADVDTSGVLRIGALKAADIEASNVTATLRSGGGRIELTRLNAAVFRGSLDASAVLAAQGRHTLRAQMNGVDAGMALRRLAGRDVLEGRGNLSLNASASGNTVSAIERSLDGTAALSLRDGALKGIDLADVLRRVRSAIAVARGSGDAIEQPASAGESTAFSSLDASFVIRDGVARSDDLDLRSPLLRVGGAGHVDLPHKSLDCLARVSVVGSLSGQGGAELAALRGVTVPVRVSGPFASLSYRVDVAGLLAGTLKQELTRRLEENLLGTPAPGSKEPSKPVTPRELLEGLLRR